MLNKKYINIFSKIIGSAVIIATGYFFFKTLSRNWGKIQEYEVSLNYFGVCLGIFFLVIAVILSGILWGKILEVLTKKKIPIRFAVYTHIYAWLLKYIPGKTGLVLGKVALGAKKGIGKKVIIVSTVYENIFLTIASFITSVPLLGFLFRDEVSSNLKLFLPALLVVPMILLITPSIFYKMINYGLQIIKKDPLKKEFFLSSSQIVKILSLYMIPRILNGIGFIILTKSFIPVSADKYLGLVATFIFSSIIGLLSFLTPGGLGVRESVMTLLLGSYFPTEISIMIAVVSRLFVTIGDIVLIIVNIVIRYFSKSRL